MYLKVTFELRNKKTFSMANITLFSQIIGKLDRLKFSKLVKEKETDKHQKGYNSWTHSSISQKKNKGDWALIGLVFLGLVLIAGVALYFKYDY